MRQISQSTTARVILAPWMVNQQPRSTVYLGYTQPYAAAAAAAAAADPCVAGPFRPASTQPPLWFQSSWYPKPEVSLLAPQTSIC